MIMVSKTDFLQFLLHIIVSKDNICLTLYEALDSKIVAVLP